MSCLAPRFSAPVIFIWFPDWFAPCVSVSGSECGMSVCSEGGPEQEPLGSRSSLEAGSETESDTNSERRAAGSRWETRQPTVVVGSVVEPAGAG